MEFVGELVWVRAVSGMPAGEVDDGSAEVLGQFHHATELCQADNHSRLPIRTDRPISCPTCRPVGCPVTAVHNTTTDGMRLTAFITDTPNGIVSGQVAGLDLRHRQHARVEDRIKDAKNTGLNNLPAWSFETNAAWLEIMATAADLLTWTRLLAFTAEPALAHCTPRTFRDRVLHIAARIIRTGRRTLLRLDASSAWASAIADGWNRLRAAFASG